MLWVRSKAVEVYLGATMVGCRGLDDSGDRWADVSDLERGLGQLDHWISRTSTPLRVRIWLGVAFARPFMVPADSGARNIAEARELASAMAADATGLADALKVWLAPWHAGRTTLAVAVPEPLLSSLRAVASPRSGRRVVSVRPWWNQVLDAVIERSRVRSRAIGWTLSEPDGLVQGRIASGEVVEGTFEARRLHDPEATTARRRLEIGWGDVDEVEHVAFAGPGTIPSETFAIGAARAVQAGEVVA